MGKTKKHVKKRAPCPTGIPSLKELEDEEAELTEDSILDSLLDKLQSSSSGDAECAAVTVAQMSGRPGFAATILERRLLRVAAPLLLHRSPSVRHAVVGALRNVSADGDASVLRAMVEQDVLTSLVALLHQYAVPWKPSKSPEEAIDSRAAIFQEACNLLWSLCESCDTAVKVFNESNLISILLPCLDKDVYGLQIPLAVAQCLRIVTDDNAAVTKTMASSPVMELLKSLVHLTGTEPECVLLKILAAGILVNVHTANPGAVMPDVMEAVGCTLSLPLLPLVERLTMHITSHKVEKSNKYREDKDLEEKLAAVEKSTRELNHILPAKQIALEILANICFGEDSDEEWEASSSDASDVMEMDVEDVDSSALKMGLRAPPEVYVTILRDGLFEKVLDQLASPPDDVIRVAAETKEGKNCLKKLNTVRCRALLCINNIVQSIDLDDLGGTAKLFDLWIQLGNLIFKQIDPSETDQVEAATGSLRAVLQKLAEAGQDCGPRFGSMTQADLEMLAELAQRCDEPAVKVNVVRALATLGTILGGVPGDHMQFELIRSIGSFLLETCCKSSELWVTAECLDALFDVFAEDHLDGVAQEIHLVERLSGLLPLLKRKIHQQRKSLEHLPVIMTAKANLIRFVKYKNENKVQRS